MDRKALSYEIHNLTRYADYQQMEKVRARADIIVDDPETAESLKPYYQQFCKRPCFHDDYLGTFNRQRPLVDTDGQALIVSVQRCGCERVRIRVSLCCRCANRATVP